MTPAWTESELAICGQKHLSLPLTPVYINSACGLLGYFLSTSDDRIALRLVRALDAASRMIGANIAHR